MTNQIQGEILFQGWSGSATFDWAYSPWMPVRGDFGMFGVEVVQAVGAATLDWAIQTRISEVFSATPIVSRTGIGVGIDTMKNAASFETQEWVRYLFKVSGTASVTKYVVFRALTPSWNVDRVGV